VALIWDCTDTEARVRSPLPLSFPLPLLSNPPYQCVPQSDPTTPYALFKPGIPSLPHSSSTPGSPTTTLEIYPAGKVYFDEILLSALAIERQRLIPARSISDPVKIKEIFNFYKEY
jgi:hypothetical protein